MTAEQMKEAENIKIGVQFATTLKKGTFPAYDLHTIIFKLGDALLASQAEAEKLQSILAEKEEALDEQATLIKKFCDDDYAMKAKLAKAVEGLEKITDFPCQGAVEVAGSLLDCREAGKHPDLWCHVCNAKKTLREIGERNE